MSERNQLVHTVCVQTKDAVETREGCFVFQMPGDTPRFKAVKLAIGSVEFPMTQWTLEESWNLFYFNEGLRVDSANNKLRVDVRSLSTAETSHVVIGIPPRLNCIIKWRFKSSRVVVTCANPHHLWSGDALLLWNPDRKHVNIVACPFGHVSILPSDLAYVSETEFSIPRSILEDIDAATAESLSQPRAGYVHVSNPPSPKHLCDLLSISARNACLDVTLSFEYDAERNGVRMGATSRNMQTHRLCVQRTPLATCLGLGVDTPFDIPSTRTEFLPCGTFQMWNAVNLTPGWYGPAHRPMCAGNPLRLSTELETAFNRLYFPVPERVPTNMITSHFIMFVDPSGQTFNSPIPAGKYTPTTLCTLIEQSMTDMAQVTTPGVVFSVAYDQGRFVFSCEVKQRSMVSPANFSLLFAHPMQCDPERFGFEALNYTGSSSYVSSNVCVCPNVNGPGQPWRSPANIYRISDLSHQKRLRIHASSVPVLMSVIADYDASESILTLRTHVGKLPYSHGFQEDDVVGIGNASNTSLFVPSGNGWSEEKVESCNLIATWGRSALVVAARGDDDAYVLRLRTKHTPELRSCVGQCLLVYASTEPFNLCVGSGLPRSIPSHTVGFREGATQWGLDGSVANMEKTLWLPPFVTPAVHNFDHPDYVLVYLDEGKRSTTLQHADANHTTTPLTKLVLYPLFREERMIPRDTTMFSGESLTRFTIRFTNPNGTPYHFHDAQFSLSLNFIKIQD